MPQTKSDICPLCASPVTDRFKPFCSKRCADIDLGRWLKGTYAISGRDDNDEDTRDAPDAEDGLGKPG